MVDDNTARRDVPQLHAVNRQEADHQGTITDNLHKSRGKEYLMGQVFGVSAAIGSVFLARRFVPKQMQALEKKLEPVIKPFCKDYNADSARRNLNTLTMLTAGLCTSLTSCVLMARNRRDGMEYADDIAISRDVSRVLLGWGVGAIGAYGAWGLAEHFGRYKTTTHEALAIVDKAERLLDRYLKNVAFEGNKLSELLVANGVMIAGAAPMSVFGQKLFDDLNQHPAYQKPFEQAR